MREDALLAGILEPTNEPYAVAKVAAIKLSESYNRQYRVDYRSVMPTNLDGPSDNFHPENSQVIPAGPFNSLGCIVCRSGLYSLPVLAEERQDALENQY